MFEENAEGRRRLMAMLPARMIEVAKLKVGDVVQPNKEPQMVEFVQVLEGGEHVLLRLSGEPTKKILSGFVYKLIRRADEDPGEE